MKMVLRIAAKVASSLPFMLLFILMISLESVQATGYPISQGRSWIGAFDQKVTKIDSHESCDQQKWPIYAGGEKGSEDVRCFVYDPINELIFVGGVSSSADFVMSPRDHGYMFALDLDGNWKWGNFYYNFAEPIA